MVIGKGQKLWNIVIMALLSVLALIMAMPFVLLLMSSITEEKTLILYGYSFFPKEFSLDAYSYLIKSGEKITKAYMMTFAITITGTFFNLLMSSMLSYGLSIKNLPGRKFFSFYVFFTMLFNGGLVPTYLMYTNIFNIKNTFAALVIPQFLISGFSVIIIRTFIQTGIPSALYEACKIDGGGHLRIYWNIVLPMGKPILVSMGLFAGLAYWNDWTNALYYVNKKELWGIQSLLNEMISNIQFLSQNSTIAAQTDLRNVPSTSIRMAIAFVGILPIMCLFPFLQKYFAKGIAVGAVKG